MINSRVELLFKNLPEKYPHQLEQNFIRILNRLMQIWNTPEFDSYMRELVIDKRSGRKGFPSGVVAELLFLSELHDIFMRTGHSLPEIPDSWKNIPVSNPTPKGFYQAIERGQMDVIEIFLRAGVKADYRFEGALTPLMVAVISGQLGAVRCLIEDGAGVNLRDECEYTALHWAAFYGHSQIVEVLIDTDAKINVKQNWGDTPLDLAIKRGHPDVAKLLEEKQADPNANSDPDLTLADSLHTKRPGNESKYSNVDNRTGGNDISPYSEPKKDTNLNKSAKLILIAFFGLAVFGLSVYPDYQKRTATTPIQNPVFAQNSVVPDASIANSGVRDTPIADPEVPDASIVVPPKPRSAALSQTNHSGKRPKDNASHIKENSAQPAVNKVAAYTYDDLTNAIAHSDTNKVDRILEQGMDINSRDSSGSTPLILAVGNNDLNMVKHLIEKGADPNMPRQRDGYSPIVVAKTSSKPNAELIEFLRTSGAHNPFDQSVNSLRH